MACWERDWWQKRHCECTWTKAALWLAFLLLTGGLIAPFAVVKPPTATAGYAFLTRFELSPSPNSTAKPPPLQLLSYNATVHIALRNPNLYRGISYLALAAFSFNGTRFDDESSAAGVVDLYLDAQEEKTVRLEVGGVDRKPPAAGAAEFARQKEAGWFEVEVRLDAVVQYDMARKTWCPLDIICPRRLQLVDSDVAAIAFNKTKCTILRVKISGC
uniref:Late embryogenesis abundant protein LEA-2 subgroup domain-containing protein n=1 Tax=Aegilops tauschii TaxID=37682 RepID=M8BEB5_AEGTA